MQSNNHLAETYYGSSVSWSQNKKHSDIRSDEILSGEAYMYAPVSLIFLVPANFRLLTSFFNPLLPNVRMHYLHTVHHALLKVLTRRIYSTIRRLLSVLSFSSLSYLKCVIQE